jgi:hypothetical protein
MENKEQKLKEIRKSKQEEYGTNFDVAMKDIGKIWSVLLGLDKDIPGYMVANLYVAAKLYRTKKKFKEDSYDDAENYLYQARIMQKDFVKGKKLKKILEEKWIEEKIEEKLFNTDGIVKDQVDG